MQGGLGDRVTFQLTSGKVLFEALGVWFKKRVVIMILNRLVLMMMPFLPVSAVVGIVAAAAAGGAAIVIAGGIGFWTRNVHTGIGTLLMMLFAVNEAVTYGEAGRLEAVIKSATVDIM